MSALTLGSAYRETPAKKDIKDEDYVDYVSSKHYI